MDTEMVKCSNCGKMVYWFDLGNHVDRICYSCTEKMTKYPILYKWYLIKRWIAKVFGKLALYLFYIVFVVFWCAIIIFWVGACFGNLNDFEEDPPPGLHWKPDKN